MSPSQLFSILIRLFPQAWPPARAQARWGLSRSPILLGGILLFNKVRVILALTLFLRHEEQTCVVEAAGALLEKQGG